MNTVKYVVQHATDISLNGQKIELDKLLNVGDKLELFGKELIVTQTGLIVTLVNETDIIVLQVDKKETPFITDWRDLKDGEDIVLDLDNHLIKINKPLSMRALYDFMKFVAPIKNIRNPIAKLDENLYQFKAPWKLADDESSNNIVQGEYIYPVKVEFII